MTDPSPKPLAGKRETHGRALAKAVSWRAVGTMDTFLWSYFITHEPASAGAIASMETFTKVALYYLHERAWRLLRWSPNARRRSLIKAFSWRAVGSLDTFILSLIVTGSGKYAISIASAEAVTKVGLYYVHERIWRKVRWGRFDASRSAVNADAEPAASA